MLTREDLLLLLDEIEQRGIGVKNYPYKLMMSARIPPEILKFVNDNRPLEINNFYEMLRKNHNKKKTPLYKNLVKGEFDSNKEVLITLASLHLQILLYAKKLEDETLFLKHSRAEEITQVLNNYYRTYDLIPCLKLLKLIRNDMKCFELLR